MDRRWISVSEASKYLSIHEITCRRLIDRGEIPAVRIGGSVRVDFKKLVETLEEQDLERTND